MMIVWNLGSMSSAIRPQHRLSSILSVFVSIGLSAAWYADSLRLNHELTSTRSEYERRLSEQIFGLTIHEESLTTYLILREYKKGNADDFREYIRGYAVNALIHLFKYRTEVDKMEQTSAQTQARKIVDLLGCRTVNEFQTIAKELGWSEDRFLFANDYPHEEGQEFYRFLGLDQSNEQED